MVCIHSGLVSDTYYDIRNNTNVIQLLSNENNEVYINPDDESMYDFNGLVGCLEISSHVFMVKQNNKYVWTGNCSRSGQKGTIGLVLHASKMPFTEDGIIPDIIMNPHAYPTRRSFAQLLENALGKIGAIKGIKIDGTPFNNIDFEKDIMEVLEELGYNGDSTETFYDGFSGRKIVKPLTVGINYYLRLKHLVDEKVYSRSNGASKPETRQPLEGRSKGGGGRLGEMERDALIAHGNSYFLKERLVDMSDIYTTHVCDICGLFAQRTNKKNNQIKPTKNDSFECNICRNKNKISQIKIPYSAKLLFQELTSMNIAPRIITDNHVDLTKYE
jgi:DNA-directed RNA polymerase II subunit RPB2